MPITKHLENAKMPGIIQLDPALHPNHPPYLEISTTEGILSAAQMNMIEFHTSNATKNAIGKPDRMTFDLDPGEGLQWEHMQQAAQLVRVFLNELGLKSFLKTSGGKGLHVVVPFKRLRDWDTVKDFSQAIVVHLAKTIPQRFVAKSGPSNRKGEIFIDYLRQWPWYHDYIRVVCSCTPWLGCVCAAGMGGAAWPHQCSSLDCLKHPRPVGYRK